MANRPQAFAFDVLETLFDPAPLWKSVDFVPPSSNASTR